MPGTNRANATTRDGIKAVGVGADGVNAYLPAYASTRAVLPSCPCVSASPESCYHTTRISSYCPDTDCETELEVCWYQMAIQTAYFKEHGELAPT
eukprot:765137-Rhodomonas_salina.2